MLETAIQKLKESGASVVFVDIEGKCHAFEGRGVQPLLDRVMAGERFPGGAMADKLVGKAAAAMAVLLGVTCVYGEIMSESGRDYLAARGVAHSCGELISHIMNRTEDDICPMEKAVQGLEDPEACLLAMQKSLAALRAGAGKS